MERPQRASERSSRSGRPGSDDGTTGRNDSTTAREGRPGERRHQHHHRAPVGSALRSRCGQVIMTPATKAGVESDGTYPASPAEQLFRVGTVLGNGATSTGSMQCGPWLLGLDDNPCFGTLGVLVDNVFGAAVLAHRPPGQWATTTEISLTFCSPLPTDRHRVEATAELDHLDPTGGVAHGRVSTSDGRLIAVGTQRTRFAAGHPASVLGRPGPPAPDESVRIADLLGVDDSPVAAIHCSTRVPDRLSRTRRGTCTAESTCVCPRWPGCAPRDRRPVPSGRAPSRLPSSGRRRSDCSASPPTSSTGEEH